MKGIIIMIHVLDSLFQYATRDMVNILAVLVTITY